MTCRFVRPSEDRERPKKTVWHLGPTLPSTNSELPEELAGVLRHRWRFNAQYGFRGGAFVDTVCGSSDEVAMISSALHDSIPRIESRSCVLQPFVATAAFCDIAGVLRHRRLNLCSTTWERPFQAQFVSVPIDILTPTRLASDRHPRECPRDLVWCSPLIALLTSGVFKLYRNENVRAVLPCLVVVSLALA